MPPHTPVLATAALDALDIVADGTYVDATFGAGGHTRLMRVPAARLRELGSSPG